jgi:hypothetical protein
MRSFTTTELTRMQSSQETAMQDTCQVLAYSSTTDAYNNPVPTWTPGAAIACGLEHLDPEEVQDTGLVPLIEARVRLPLDTALDALGRDRIRVTHRYGAALVTAQEFEIVGPPRRGPSGLVVDLHTVVLPEE